MQDSIRTAVQEALACSAALKAGDYERYVKLWQGDLREWEQRLVSLPVGLSVEKALKELDLAPAADGGTPGGSLLSTGASSNDRPVPFSAIPTPNGSRATATPLPAQPEPLAAQADDTLPFLAIDFGPYIPDPGRQAVPDAASLGSLRAPRRRTLRSTAVSLVRPTTR
jgi:hypothetical protein